MEAFPFCKCFFQKNREFLHFFPLSEQPVLPSPGHPAIIRLDVHQNDVRTDPADAVPGDAKVLLFAHQTEKTAGAGDDNSADLPIGHLHHHIGNKPQPSAVVDTDDFLALQRQETLLPKTFSICRRPSSWPMTQTLEILVSWWTKATET